MNRFSDLTLLCVFFLFFYGVMAGSFAALKFYPEWSRDRFYEQCWTMGGTIKPEPDGLSCVRQTG